jgi:hypothetical protein
MNELAHDAAVMVDNNMARFSHGFRALEFDELKEEEGEVTGPGGFDIKRFEIMEESIVSVPSNVDAQVEEQMLDLIEGGRMTSGLMKELGKTMRDKRPVTISVEKEVQDEDQSGSGSTEAERREETADAACPPEETEAVDVETKEETAAEDTEVKAGRRLSNSTRKLLMEVKGDLEELMDREEMSRGGSAMCERCIKKLGSLVDEELEEEAAEPVAKLTAADAQRVFLATATDKQIESMAKLTKSMVEISKKTNRASAIRRRLS